MEHNYKDYDKNILGFIKDLRKEKKNSNIKVLKSTLNNNSIYPAKKFKYGVRERL